VQPEKTPRERAEDLISLLVSDWRPTSRQVWWSIRIAVVLGLLFAIGHYYGVTAWDWLKLLIVPAVIAAGGLWFNAQQRDRERERANEHARDEALQAYLDQMGQLLLDKDSQLGKSKEGDEVQTLARAWTLTVLTRLDGLRKRSVVQFLYEAKLITKDSVALDLREANLNFANLNGANLTAVNLRGVSLTKAKINDTKLGQADLSDTMMFGANLLMAELCRADMSRAVLMSENTDSIPLQRLSATRNYVLDSPGPKNADLSGADLRGVDLTDAYVSEEQLRSAESLEGATMPNGLKHEEWLKRKGRGEDEEYTGPS
jgi:uncharacterized protein YjbI with pentapeptide repeats